MSPLTPGSFGTHHTITTNLNINVLESNLEVPKTGFFTDLISGEGEAIPVIVFIVIGLAMLAMLVLLVLIVRRISRRPRLQSRFHSPFRKRFVQAMRVFAIMLVLGGIAVLSMLPHETSAAEESLITISLSELSDVTLKPGESIDQELKLSIDTASLNDLELNVAFANLHQHHGITISSEDTSIELPAGTTSTTMPITIAASADAERGGYQDKLEVTVGIQEGFWRTKGRDFVDWTGHTVRLNSLNAHITGAPNSGSAYPLPEHFLAAHNDFVYAEMEELGINAVRLNFPARIVADSCTTSACLTYDYSEEVFAALDQILEYASSHNVGIIFNIHQAYGSEDGARKWNSFLPENIAKTTALWEQIAEKYKDDKRVLGYELMNEPMVRLESSQTATDAINIWDTVAQNMINSIRAIDKNHTILVEKVHSASKNNGATVLFPPESYLFPSVSDPVSNNLVLAFHDYGNWAYATQSDARAANDPWVWPNTDFLAVTNRPAFVADNPNWVEGWPRAAYVANANNQNAWVEVSSGAPANVPMMGSNRSNIATIGVTGGSGYETNSVTYVDDIRVNQYDQAGNFEKTIYTQTFSHVGAIASTTARGQIVMDESVCYDAQSGCFRITGETNNTVDNLDLKYFRVDPSKKYAVTARFHGANLPADKGSSIIFNFAYATEETVRPYDKSYLHANIQNRVNYSKEHNIPIMNTEWGLLVDAESWDKVGGEQYVQDFLEVYKENNVSASYFAHYGRNTNAQQPRSTLRVREYNVPYNDPITAENTTLNTHLYDAFMSVKD